MDIGKKLSFKVFDMNRREMVIDIQTLKCYTCIIMLVASIFSATAQTGSASVMVSIVCSTQEACIHIDDVERGVDSCEVKLLPGTYTIKSTKKGYRDKVIQVNISSQPNQRVIIPEMESLFALLKVNYQPYGSNVYINGERRGVTPLSLNLPLTVYGLKIEHNGKVLFNSPIVLNKEGENVIVDNELGIRCESSEDFQVLQDNDDEYSRALGDLTISCPTKDADILINGVKIQTQNGRTYWTGKYACGKHTVTITKPGYEDRTVDVDVNVTYPSAAYFAPLKKIADNTDNSLLLSNVRAIPEDSIFEIANDFPSFPEGKVALEQYLKKHIQYPELADRNYIDGEVDISFVIEKDGSVTNLIQNSSKIIKYNGLVKNNDVADDLSKKCFELFYDEIRRAFNTMPKWNAAMIGDDPIRFRYHMNILFGQGCILPQAALLTNQFRISGTNSLENLFSKVNKVTKDIILYQVGNDCWISGFNKNIMNLSDEEMNQVKNTSLQVYKDVIRMRQFLNNELDIYDFLGGDKHPSTSRPEYEMSIDYYMKTQLENSTSKNSIFVKVSFFVETDGTISSPVVEKTTDSKLARKIVNFLRDTKNWKPAQKNGKSICSRISRTFAYKRI